MGLVEDIHARHAAQGEWFPTVPGRCESCHWHVPTMGHKADCATPQSSGEPEKPRDPLDDLPWLSRMKAQKAAAKAAANGEPSPEPPTSTHSGESPAGHTNTALSTRTDDELEAWAQAGIDRELDLVEADPPPGTRNDRLNKRALRCFRLALLAGFDLDDVYNALFGAAPSSAARRNRAAATTGRLCGLVDQPDPRRARGRRRTDRGGHKGIQRQHESRHAPDHLGHRMQQLVPRQRRSARAVPVDPGAATRAAPAARGRRLRRTDRLTPTWADGGINRCGTSARLASVADPAH